jgi:hypothetical protein
MTCKKDIVNSLKEIGYDISLIGNKDFYRLVVGKTSIEYCVQGEQTNFISKLFLIYFHDDYKGYGVAYHPNETILKQPTIANSYKEFVDNRIGPLEKNEEYLLIEDVWGYNILYNRECLFQKILLEDGIGYIEKPDFWNWVKKCK